jgi:hypothetical protein
MAISEKLKALIRSAWDDGAPCLVATQGPNGPNISPKGSMVVFDDDHLAYWERSKKQALENLGHDKRVCVIYANFKAQRDGVLDSGFLRFYGKAELHESGPVITPYSICSCRASKRMSARILASACWSRSTARRMFGASHCLEITLRDS